MIKINLVSEGKKPVVARAPKGPSMEGVDLGQWLLLLGILVGLGIVGMWWFTLNRTINANQEDIRQAERTVKELQEIINEVEEFERQEAELEHKIAVITELKNNQQGPVRIMDEISLALPELVWLDRLQLRASSVTLTGRAFNHNAVANFIYALDQVREFQEPYLRDVTKRGSVYSFAIDFNFAVAPPPPATTTAATPTGG